MATYTSCLENPHPGESPWTEEPGRLQSIELHRVGLKRVSMQAHTWHCDLIRMLPRHLDFKSSPGDPNVQEICCVRRVLVWNKLVLIALALYMLFGLGELGLMTNFGLGFRLGIMMSLTVLNLVLPSATAYYLSNKRANQSYTLDKEKSGYSSSASSSASLGRHLDRIIWPWYTHLIRRVQSCGLAT